MRYASISLTLALLLGLTATPVDAGEPGWRARAFGARLDPDTRETTVTGDGDDILLEADGGFGGGASVECQFNRSASTSSASPPVWRVDSEASPPVVG